MTEELTNKEMLAEIRFVMRFSRVYFDAFKITNDRVKYFRLLCILVAATPTERQVLALLQNSDVLKLLDLKQDQEPRHKFEALIQGFRNDRGPFLKLMKTKPYSDRYYAFTSNYDEAVREYLVRFKENVAPNLNLPARLQDEEARAIFKHIGLHPVWMTPA